MSIDASSSSKADFGIEHSPLKTYRLYLLDNAGCIARALENRFHSEDAAAEWARDLAHPLGKELWQGGRLVLCFTARGEAWKPGARSSR